MVSDRFDRFRRIAWWEQARLEAARFLVVGAGALGNEILKNLALLGAGRIFVADMDLVEASNLSRSVLFRERDEGRSKALVAAEAVHDIFPAARVAWFHGDVVHDLGLGVYRWADIVVAGVDNREARLHINRCCWKTNRPWIDGATEILDGVVRVFVPPGGPCYECTMSVRDWDVLNERQGCAGLRAAETPAGRVPTTPVTASIIAALQCQEALKLLHGLDGLAGRGLVFNGLSNDAYVVPYTAHADCNSHDTYERIVPTNGRATTVTLRELLTTAQSELGRGAVLDLNHEIVTAFACLRCGAVQEVFRPRGSIPERTVVCPRCGEIRRVVSTEQVDGSEPFLDRTLARVGIPPYDIVVGRRGSTRVAFELAGDAPAVLGGVAATSVSAEGGGS
jgi:adenylyltransferase/sulfurtransferase